MPCCTLSQIRQSCRPTGSQTSTATVRPGPLGDNVNTVTCPANAEHEVRTDQLTLVARALVLRQTGEQRPIRGPGERERRGSLPIRDAPVPHAELGEPCPGGSEIVRTPATAVFTGSQDIDLEACKRVHRWCLYRC